ENVIRQAGTAIARRAEQLTKAGDFILVLCGKGHNGDDARIAAEAICERKVNLLSVTDPEAVAAELAALLARKPALLIDGLFGIGLNRALRLDWIKLIQQINSAEGTGLAVDVPS